MSFFSPKKSSLVFGLATSWMKLLISVIAVFSIGHSHGQAFEHGLNRAQLKGYKKITDTRTYSSEADSAEHKTISFIDELGDIIKTETYENATLTNWTKYEYDKNGHVTYEEDHGQVFSYDEQVKGHVGKVRDDYYHAKVFEYEKGLLVKEVWFHNDEGYKTYDYTITYEYSRSKRLMKKVHTNKYVGPVVGFKPGTDVLDTTYNKNDVTQYADVYFYKSNTVTVVHYNEKNAIDGCTITTLSATKKPVSIVNTDHLKKPIDVTTITYDKNDNAIRELNKLIAPEKINSDGFYGGEYLTTYNKRKLPILQLVKEKGKVLSRNEIKYE
jgi:hypothetical protein